MVGGVKDKTDNLFKTNTTKDYIKPTRVTTMCMGMKRNQENQK